MAMMEKSHQMQGGRAREHLQEEGPAAALVVALMALFHIPPCARKCVGIRCTGNYWVIYTTTDANGTLPLFCNRYCSVLLANLHQNKFGRLSRRSRQSKKR